MVATSGALLQSGRIDTYCDSWGFGDGGVNGNENGAAVAADGGDADNFDGSRAGDGDNGCIKHEVGPPPFESNGVAESPLVNTGG